MNVFSWIQQIFSPQPPLRRKPPGTNKPRPDIQETSTQRVSSPDVPIRFSMSESYTTVHSAPRALPGPVPGLSVESYQFHLATPLPAQLQYILGVDWRERCIVTSENDRNTMEWSYIPSSGDIEDEAEHCLRMRRCGAHVIGMVTHDRKQKKTIYNKKIKQTILGWPSGGGVWVFRYPKEYSPYDIAPIGDPDSEHRIKIEHQVRDMEEELKKQEDMEGFCEVLRANGAKFYDQLGICPEVTLFKLFDASQSEKFLRETFEKTPA